MLKIYLVCLMVVNNMGWMFKDCQNLKSLNLFNFDTRKVTKLNGMFENCFNLKIRGIEFFDTSKVEDMSRMFFNCKSLVNLDIKFNTLNTFDMSYMFAGCLNLKSLDLSTFSTKSTIKLNNMFDEDEGLDLYINKNNCENLLQNIPIYINVHDVSNNY